ncbi:hypothetical protein M2T70_04775 [Elizabethkingia anophelis]|uniref:hypothetical protein n=1 Tax=Elizabethkingia anophelis TaxID=1117645 RepID=UPI00161AEF1B|nr:hypothetical protein [Elizabethkingia anophelis]MCL1648258.1 hypothetical protein [Elizabethkingia anophelis]MCL1683652.1 hypothetical protein [Elizabethkingia anophelis]
MKAEEAYQIYKAIIGQIKDPGEILKLNNLILGAVEDLEKRKARIAARLDGKERYRIKK